MVILLREPWARRENHPRVILRESRVDGTHNFTLTGPFSEHKTPRYPLIVARSLCPGFITAVAVARPRAQPRLILAVPVTSARNVTPRTLAAQRRRKTRSCVRFLRQLTAHSNLARASWSKSASPITKGGCARRANTIIHGKPVILCSRARTCTGLEATIHRCVLHLMGARDILNAFNFHRRRRSKVISTSSVTVWPQMRT